MNRRGVSIIRASKREEWLSELRDWQVDGVVSSGGYCPRKEVVKEIADACGLPFPPNGTQTKSEWRQAVIDYFERTEEVGA